MSKRNEWTNEKVAAMYEKKGANMSATATAMGISRRTLVRWRDADVELDGMMRDVDESLLDFSESKLIEAINDGNLTAIIFHLKTKGKSRGYIESVENNVKMEQPIQLSMDKAREFINSLENEY